MTTILRRASGALLAALCLVSGLFAQESREVKQYSIEQFLKTVNYSGASFSPDREKILVSSDQTGVFNAYALYVDGRDPEPLTKSTVDSVFALGYFPNDERFLYSSDQGGNELDHIYLRNEDGTTVDLTPGENLKAQFYGWSQDDRSFFIGTNERDRRYFDVYQYDAQTFDREMIFQNDDGYSYGDITPDNQTLALSKTNSRDDSNTYLYDRESGEIRLITEHEGDANYRPASFSPDGKSLYLITDADSDFKYLIKHDPASGDRETIEQPNWDVAFAGFSKHGKYFLVGINEDAKTRFKVYDAATMQPIDMPDIETADIASFGISRDEKHVAIYASSDKMPRDLFYWQIGSEAPVKLTSSLNPQINPDDLVSSEVVRFKSFDGVQIPGILYRPHQASELNKVPALVWVHGGPGGQSRIGYRALIQYLVNHGYAVYAINNRGSSGYGKKFEQMDNRNHGKGDLKDCVTSKRMLIETGYVDPDRIGIIGGSYGGYMVLAALTFAPQEFQVGVDIFGISNWYRTVQSIPPWWEAQRAALEKEMGDFSDEEYFKSISPLFHAEQIQQPLMVLQGANDPRVLKVESDEIVEAVRANGVPVKYIVFDDEGHGFQKKANQLKGYSAILEFLNEHLK